MVTGVTGFGQLLRGIIYQPLALASSGVMLPAPGLTDAEV